MQKKFIYLLKARESFTLQCKHSDELSNLFSSYYNFPFQLDIYTPSFPFPFPKRSLGIRGNNFPNLDGFKGPI